MDEAREPVVIQPAEFLKQLKIEVPEPERFIDAILSFLFWMPQDTSFSTNVFNFSKLDKNTIYCEAVVEADELVNVLAKSDVRIPI